MENTEDPKRPVSSLQSPASGLLGWFAANPVAANLLMAIIFLGGTLSLLRIDKQAYPRFAAPYVNITAAYPGAGPAEVEEGVCIPIEEAIHDLRGIKHIETSALDGVCNIKVEIEQGQDIQAFVSGVRARTQSLRNLPKAVERIEIDDYGWESAAITVVLRGQADKFTLRQLAERVRDELSALAGVRRATLWNTVAYEIAVEVPAARLRRHGLTLSEVAAAVRKSSLDLPGGELKASAGEFQLRAKYTAYDRARLLGLILRTHPDGSVLKLGDIAEVTDGFADQHFENTSDGYPSESIWVTPQHDLVEVAEEVKGYVETLAARLPDGIEVITWRDNARSFVELLDTLAFEGITGFCLVLLVLMLFLRTQVAFWAAVGVLISIFGAFWWLPAAGVTLNMLSLFGFVLAMGVLVDDAIIVSERIHELQEQGVSGLQGAIQGSARGGDARHPGRHHRARRLPAGTLRAAEPGHAVHETGRHRDDPDLGLLAFGVAPDPARAPRRGIGAIPGTGRIGAFARRAQRGAFGVHRARLPAFPRTRASLALRDHRRLQRSPHDRCRGDPGGVHDNLTRRRRQLRRVPRASGAADRHALRRERGARQAIRGRAGQGGGGIEPQSDPHDAARDRRGGSGAGGEGSVSLCRVHERGAPPFPPPGCGQDLVQAYRGRGGFLA
jgi:hypothetical protein